VTKADDLISPELQERFVYLGQLGDDAAWEIGDHADDLVQEFPAVKPHEVYEAIALYSQRPLGTIRAYHYLSARVPKRLRNVYPQLGRSHLKVLADAARGDEGTLEALMEAWILERGFGSVDGMHLWLRDAGNGVKMWEKRLKRMIAAAEKMAADDEAPPEICMLACSFLEGAEEYR
jgi:hypothetical protein